MIKRIPQLKTWAVLLCLSASGRAGAVEVTVYNQNLGLVKETRTFTFKAGMNDIEASDVAAQIDPTSVHFKSLTEPETVKVAEQNFEYDLISQDKLLEKYLGKEIELERFLGPNGEKRETIKGILLSVSGGRVLKSNGKLLVNPPGNPILGELPEGLRAKPALLWKIFSKNAGRRDCEMSYLTSGLSWQSDYVLVANAADDRMDLNAWVTINNNSGAAYKDAKLKLVAGDVHQAPRPAGRRFAEKAMMFAAPVAAPQFEEKPFFEYHLYTLSSPTTLRENETKQIELASAAEVPLKKLYIYDASPNLWGEFNDYTRMDPSYGAEGQKKVAVTLEFKNSKKDNLGIPLPKGKVRVYKSDPDGSLEFIGEDSIDHTPKDEKVRVKMGDAFDVVGERKRTDFQTDGKKRWAMESFELRLRNHKDSPVSVTAVEHLYRWSGWKITDASQKWTKKDAQTVEFEVPVDKDGESVVTYTVKYAW